MENADVIKKLDDPREWLNLLITVERPDGTLSLCLDLRDLKWSREREDFQLPTFDDISTRLAGVSHFT